MEKDLKKASLIIRKYGDRKKPKENQVITDRRKSSDHEKTVGPNDQLSSFRRRAPTLDDYENPHEED